MAGEEVRKELVALHLPTGTWLQRAGIPSVAAADWRARCLGLSCGGVLLFALGCATTPESTAVASTGDAVAEGRSQIESGPPRDRVLWQYRTALEAMRRGEFAEPKQWLDAALLQLGGVSAGDRTARRSRGYFAEESAKTFRGEPYERAMAYFYRGILYWRDGEPDNARACFRSAQFEDTDAADPQHKSDFVLFHFLDGLATERLGGDGSDGFKRARAAAKLAVPPLLDRNANVLVFLEYGSGPIKYAAGNYGEQLRFHPGHASAREVVLRAAGVAARVGPYDDLTFQATTRGGRVMDHVLGNKAVFKSTTDAVGNAALITGGVLAMDHDTEAAGLALVAAGLVSKIFSAAATPAADVRCWHNLPQFLSFAALQLPPGLHTLTVEYLDYQDRPLPGWEKRLEIEVAPPPADTVLFVSDRMVFAQTSAPGK
jgi:hypothetical protein